MPKLFVFAIGGTGERVMRSLTMLMAAGAPAFDNYEVYPIIVDCDLKNADKLRCAETLQCYSNIHNAAFGRHTANSDSKGMKDQFFACDVRDLTRGADGEGSFTFPFKPETPQMTFREYIGYGTLNGELMRTYELLQALYDESNRPDAELNLRMDLGFKGNPNIGSVVFNDLGDHPIFQKFISLFQPGNDDKVMVIGSIFGGTGASGIPEIANAIHARKPQADIAALLVLPYFAPQENKDGAIQAARFNSKTKAALSFYESSAVKKKFSRIYYVGDNIPTVVKYSEGGETQKNNANLVEVIAALMVEDYISGRTQTGTLTKDLKFSIDMDMEAKESGSRVLGKHFDEASVKHSLTSLIWLGMALKFVHEDVLTDGGAPMNAQLKSRGFAQPIGLSEAVEGDNSKLDRLIKELNKFYGYYKEWMAELDYPGNGKEFPPNSHRLGLVDISRPYADIVMKETAEEDADDKKGVLDKVGSFFSEAMKGGDRKASADRIIGAMEDGFRDNGESGHFVAKGSQLRSGHEEEWVFADLLRKAVVTVCTGGKDHKDELVIFK